MQGFPGAASTGKSCFCEVCVSAFLNQIQVYNWVCVGVSCEFRACVEALGPQTSTVYHSAVSVGTERLSKWAGKNHC